MKRSVGAGCDRANTGQDCPTPYKESDMIRTTVVSILFLGAIYGAIYAVHDGILWLSFTAGICVAAAVEVLRK